MLDMRKGMKYLVVAFGVSLFGTAASAEEWPTRVVTIVVPYQAGGSADMVGRLLAKQMEVSLGQAVVVENRAGAGGTVGAGYVAKAKPDGYTLLFANAAHTAAPVIMPDIGYDFFEMAHVTDVMAVPNILVVKRDLPVNTPEEFIKYLKSNPGSVTYGSAGIGTTQQLATELLKQQKQVDAVHVPYKGATPMMVDLIGGRLDFTIQSTPIALAQIKGGYLKPIAVTSLERLSILPDIPTIHETVLPDYQIETWYSLHGPKGMPDEVKEKLYAVTVDALKTPEFQKLLESTGARPGGMKSEDFSKFVRDEGKRWKSLTVN